MSAEKNKAFVRSYFEQIWNESRGDLLEEYWDEDFVYHGGPANLDELMTGYTSFLDAFGDIQYDIQDMVAEEDKVVIRSELSATNQGEFMGIPSTGKPVKFTAFTIFRLANDKIAEAWVSLDNLGLMQQLGAIPTPETS